MRKLEKKDYLIILSVLLFFFLIIPVSIIKRILSEYLSFLDKWAERPMQIAKKAIVSKIDDIKTSDKGDMIVPQLAVVKISIKINANKVTIVGDFTKWQEREMIKDSSDNWSFTIPLTKGVYRYLFIVDGKEMLDPVNPDVDFFDNKKVSVLRVR